MGICSLFILTQMSRIAPKASNFFKKFGASRSGLTKIRVCNPPSFPELYREQMK